MPACPLKTGEYPEKDVKLKEDDDFHFVNSCDKTRIAFVYDDNSASLTTVEPTTRNLLQMYITLDNSAGNTSSVASKIECFKSEPHEPHCNYHGPKVVIPNQEALITICKANTTIGNVRS